MNQFHNPRYQDISPFTSSHGEIVRELAGNAAGGLVQHSVAHITLPPGKASLKHYHPVAEESYYMLSGTARVVIDGKELILQPGQMLAIQPPAVHQIFNPSETEEITFLAICTPPWTPDCSVFFDD